MFIQKLILPWFSLLFRCRKEPQAGTAKLSRQQDSKTEKT
jgi:hypothetical protein